MLLVLLVTTILLSTFHSRQPSFLFVKGWPLAKLSSRTSLWSSLMSSSFSFWMSSSSSQHEHRHDNGDADHATNSNLVLDRFQAVCPASRDLISLFDPTLVVLSKEDKAHSNDKHHADDDEPLASTRTTIWVAVYRSHNNKPSVLPEGDSVLSPSDLLQQDEQYLRKTNKKDENSWRLLAQARLEVARRASTRHENNKSNIQDDEKDPNLISLKSSFSFNASNAADDHEEQTDPNSIPVAVARLHRSFPPPSSSLLGTDATSTNTWLLDTLRCSLRKESIDPTTDGNSEHCEALSVAIDTLVQQYLFMLEDDSNNNNENEPNVLADHTSSNSNHNEEITEQSTKHSLLKPNFFHGAIRTKATLVSAKLLEARGFQPVSSLQYDMATHISDFNHCFECYADRVASTTLHSSPLSRQRAANIVYQLGQLNSELDTQKGIVAIEKWNNVMSQSSSLSSSSSKDPWASIKRFM